MASIFYSHISCLDWNNAPRMHILRCAYLRSDIETVLGRDWVHHRIEIHRESRIVWLLATKCWHKYFYMIGWKFAFFTARDSCLTFDWRHWLNAFLLPNCAPSLCQEVVDTFSLLKRNLVGLRSPAAAQTCVQKFTGQLFAWLGNQLHLSRPLPPCHII